MNELEAHTHAGGPWVSFVLAGELFAVRAQQVQEVLRAQPLTPVPLASPSMVGLLNLRGQILPSIDLRRRLGFSPRTDQVESTFLVLKNKDDLINVVVDGVGDVLDIEPASWRPPPPTLAAVHRAYVFGISPIDAQIVLGFWVESLDADETAMVGKS